MIKNKSAMVISLSFLLAAALGKLNELNGLLKGIIEEKPLPKLYFLIFFIVGLALPAIMRFLSRNRRKAREIFDPYLTLLFAQILTETILVIAIGKHIGVIVGFVFSIARLIQLKQLLPLSKGERIIQLTLYIQVILWAVNIIHISFNRIAPLIII